jgi:hypothetical protein
MRSAAIVLLASGLLAACGSVLSGTGVKSLELGALHACALRPDGALSCWGSGKVSPTPKLRFAQVDASPRCTCGVDLEGKGHCWASHVEAPWPYEKTRKLHSMICVSPPAEQRFASISAGIFHHCGLTTDGGVVCWGALSFTLPADKGPFRQVVVSEENVCVLKADGAASCVGRQIPGCMEPPRDAFQQLSLRSTGVGFTTNLVVPQVVCGLTRAGQVKCWGYPWYDAGKNRLDVHWYRRPLAFSPPLVEASLTVNQRFYDILVAVELGRVRPDHQAAVNMVAGVGGSAAGAAAGLGLAIMSAIPVDQHRRRWSRWHCLDRPPEGQFSDVQVAGPRVCAVRTDGKPICWGYSFGCPREVSLGPPQPLKRAVPNVFLPVGEEALCKLGGGGEFTCRGTGGMLEGLEQR